MSKHVSDKSAREAALDTTKSFIVHICKLGVLYHVFGKVFVTGIFPKNRSLVLTFQYPKLGIETITDFPILKSSFNTLSGS